VNANQSEVQKRYRERKKNKMAELESTVEELRSKVLELEQEKQRHKLHQLQQQELFSQKLLQQKEYMMMQAAQLRREQSNPNASGGNSRGPKTPPLDAFDRRL
jgi:phosphoketolase